MSRHVLERRQLIPADMASVFGFFEDPHNLEEITPPWLGFEVVAATDPRVRRGTEIAYRLRWMVFPIRWRSTISEYERGVRFADEMLRGPYRSWYHRHLFHVTPEGVEMVDTVRYELPLGPLGRLAHAAFVRRQLESIFDYRRRAIERIFDGHPARER
jgi:ligand-binding SRPBCC domain-containing protein